MSSPDAPLYIVPGAPARFERTLDELEARGVDRQLASDPRNQVVRPDGELEYVGPAPR